MVDVKYVKEINGKLNLINKLQHHVVLLALHVS